MPKVWNTYQANVPEGAIDIGRGTPYGNPFTHLKGKTLALIRVATRQASVDFYEAMLTDDPDNILGQVFDTPEIERQIRKRAAWIREHVHELAGEDLVCYCAPAACHGDILLRLAKES